MFVGKSFEELQTDLQNALLAEGAAVTDLNKGSILYTIGRGLLRLLADGYREAEGISADSTPATATDEALELTGNMLGLEKNLGSNAQGYLIATPKGLVEAQAKAGDMFIVGGAAVMVVQATTLMAPPYALVPVKMGIIGSRWNLAAGVTVKAAREDLNDSFSFAVGSALDVNNQPVGGFSGGQDIEVDDHLRDRIALRILALQKGTNPAVTGATDGMPFVKSVKIAEHSPMMGMLTLYVDDGTASPSLDAVLRAKIMDELYDVRSTGIGVVLKSIEKLTGDIVLAIKVPKDSLGRPLIPYEEAQTTVSNAVSDALFSFNQGEPLYLSQLVSLAREAEPRLLDVKVESPLEDVIPTAGQVFRPSKVMVSAS